MPIPIPRPRPADWTAPSTTRLRACCAALLGLLALGASGVAQALPASSYQVESISQPGATSTHVRGVDGSGRALVYWTLFTEPPPRPIGAEPDDAGYAIWQEGVSTPFSVPGLTNPNIHQMNVAGDMWGSSDEGAFVYRGGAVTIVDEPSVDVTLVQGVDAAGRIYGTLGNYPPGVDPDDLLVPIDPVGSFVFEDGSFGDLDLLLEGALLQGVRQDGALWGSNAQDSFVQHGLSLTILDYPGFDYTGLHGLTADDEAYGFGLTATETTFENGNFFWDPLSGFAPIPDDAPLPGTDVQPQAMSEAGVFWGILGDNTAFVATPVPEPGTALLLSLAVALALRRGSRRRTA